MNSGKASAPANDYPTWAPRFWHGMRPGVWWEMLSRNQYQVAWDRMHIAIGVSLINPLNSLLAAGQHLAFGRKIRRAEITQPPVFILGHWRSGTTLLHELLVTDPQFAYPNTYQCFAPSHFLISGGILTRFGGFLLPKKRPMDEMAAGWNLPQEDEFALMNLGAPSPYLRIAFPQSQEQHLDYLDMLHLDSQALQHWQAVLLRFLKALTIACDGRRLVLKSPTHTGRIGQLHQMFPKAKFIHLTRDPRKLFPSTMRLWRSLDHVQALQDSYNEDQLIAYVRECLHRMYDGYNAGRQQVPDDQVLDVRYEDLVADPKSTLKLIYQKMDLGDFEKVSPLLDSKLVGHKEYRTNRHATDDDWEREVMSYCHDYAQRFGYA